MLKEENIGVFFGGGAGGTDQIKTPGHICSYINKKLYHQVGVNFQSGTKITRKAKVVLSTVQDIVKINQIFRCKLKGDCHLIISDGGTRVLPAAYPSAPMSQVRYLVTARLQLHGIRRG